MDDIAGYAEEALHATPHPALRLTELRELVARRAGPSLTLGRLRTTLEGRPDRFRILESWKSPWRVREAASSSDGPAGARDAWVVAVSDPDRPPDAPKPALTLRESVRWVALSLDSRSRMEASRWYAIALAERAAREAVVRRAA